MALSGFWISTIIIVYTYVGYGVLMWAITKMKGAGRKPTHRPDEDLPGVTIVVAAYNESDFIAKKIRNTFDLDYPGEKLKVFIVTDGSTDGTPEIAKQFKGIRLFHRSARKGKIHAVNRVMNDVDTPIVVFSDANTFLNSEALRNIVRHYQDPEVGGVAGEKRIFKKTADNAPASGEGMYWRYESFLKEKDSQLYSVVGAAGELFSVRTSLYEQPSENMIIEDFYISMRVVAKGYRFIYEPEAYAVESASATIADEWKRKVRIAAGGFQAIVKLAPLLNVFKYGVATFQYVSHRVLRWTLAPLALVTVLVCNVVLALQGLIFYQAILLCQVVFYIIAILGHLYRNKRISIKGFFVPFYFMVMNLSVFAGFVRYLFGKQSVMWEKTRRAF